MSKVYHFVKPQFPKWGEGYLPQVKNNSLCNIISK